ncbi:MAG TPA: metalloregulator ArsR/SmtB family transcription factor [Candidatus Dormibacteraeota bacterium]|nr:metalloregulator ArsR/SmtB family transcription factor [Candidatus Dormibacteraeota bacterium]
MSVLRDFKADLFKALAHPIRIMILDALRDGEMPVRGIQERLGIEQSTISQHLAALRSSELVLARREGTSIYYGVADPAIWELLDIAREIYERQLHANRRMFEALG